MNNNFVLRLIEQTPLHIICKQLEDSLIEYRLLNTAVAKANVAEANMLLSVKLQIEAKGVDEVAKYVQQLGGLMSRLNTMKN